MDQTARMILLRSLPFFGGMPETRLTRLAALARLSRFGTGEAIAGRDDTADAFHLVVSGRAKIYQLGAQGKEQTLYLLGPGEPFCLCALVDGGEFPAFAAALEPSAILVFPAGALAEVAKDDPAVLFDLLRLMCRRLKEAMGLVESLSLRELPARVAVFLLHEARRTLAGETLRLDISQRELAKVVGATPEALSRALKRLSESGHIAVRGREVAIRDERGLAALAGLVAEDISGEA
ncbi:MAG: Crp/Fnr family transcriptional regulator [Solidesulfovibrio sp. DCME]|uniref:Crp/Fnr family transcriptional regulator n=1 Tax=Solidesulfovibrio sp. DCME TaxID=3447380 RepID=UPI003D0B7B22